MTGSSLNGMNGTFFSGDSHVLKPVITYAADMIVYVNGMTSKLVIPINNKTNRVGFQDDIMTASIDLSVDNAGSGSANFSMVVPRHSEKQYFKYGKPIIKPMMEVEVYLKGRFLDENEQPVYYPAFWGLVTDIHHDYSGGQHVLEFSCADILYFWAITTLNTKPSVLNLAWDPSVQMTEYASIFNHLNPYEIMIALAYIMTGQLTPPKATQAFRDANKSRATFGQENSAAMEYWALRNEAIGNRFSIFGIAGGENGPDILYGDSSSGDISTIARVSKTRRDEIIAKIREIFPAQGQKPVKSKSYFHTRAGFSTNKLTTSLELDGKLFDYFFPFNAGAQSTDFTAGEMQSRLEIANQVKEFINYEFFMDTTGEIVFKPPFYNMDVRMNDPVSIIRDEDIISMSNNETCRELLTRLDVFGAYSTYYEDGDENSIPYGAFVDYNMSKEYGVKAQEVTRSFLRSSDLCTIYAISELSRYNAKRFTSSLTIVGRPELRMGYPVYIESIDTFYYVTGISHSYSATGKLETTLALEAARRKHLVYENGEIVAGADLIDTDVLRPKMRGFPNAVLIAAPPPNGFRESDNIALTKEVKDIKNALALIDQSLEELRSVSGDKRDEKAIKSKEEQKKEKLKQLATKQEEQNAALRSANQKVEEENKRRAGLVYNVPPGSTIQDAVSSATTRLANNFVGQNFQTYGAVQHKQLVGKFHATLNVIPISDEAGYEVIGGFGYGRGMSLMPNGTFQPTVRSLDAYNLRESSSAFSTTQFDQESDTFINQGSFIEYGKGKSKAFLDSLNNLEPSNSQISELRLNTANQITGLSSRASNGLLDSSSLYGTDITGRTRVSSLASVYDTSSLSLSNDILNPKLDDRLKNQAVEADRAELNLQSKLANNKFMQVLTKTNFVSNFAEKAPDTSSGQTFDARRTDHVSSQLGVNAGDPNYNYGNVGKYLSDFAEIPGLSNSNPTELTRKLAETNRAIQSASQYNGFANLSAVDTNLESRALESTAVQQDRFDARISTSSSSNYSPTKNKATKTETPASKATTDAANKKTNGKTVTGN